MGVEYPIIWSGNANANCYARFSKKNPLRIHQNTPIDAQNSFFCGGPRGLTPSIPLTDGPPLLGPQPSLLDRRLRHPRIPVRLTAVKKRAQEVVEVIVKSCQNLTRFLLVMVIMFSKRIVNIWNSLPDNVVSATSVSSFKRRLACVHLSALP